jgi:hypothetical protein
MRFYHCYFTDLPDQFVEANSNRLERWTDKWADNPYLVQSRIIDGVQINLSGKAKRDNWPTLKCGSQRMLDLWMHNKGGNYNGGYWGTLTEDQRDPHRVTRGAGRDDTLDATLYSWISPGTIARSSAAHSGLTAMSIRQIMLDMEGKPKPPLKRESVVAGEIVGYRCWKIEGGMLRSVYQSDVWKPGEILAGRELGDWDSRGIHAWKDAGSKQYHEYIRAYLNAQSDPWPRLMFIGSGSLPESGDKRPAMVTGTVFLWGDVVEHERGWRAEYARVRSLDWLYPDAGMMGREQEALDELRHKYGVSDMTKDHNTK